ncbi:tetrahydrofolate dehydrogenase/cyclohydrolase catalytic domain-containing protein [Salinicoccus hispanicus]|uniref:tetrahydrofolate dehydrogenase/cyclohydrolase catalytic domain-containing protein n=1 Tax=Salinicoccus hispanicus TaxID=157225 RepID=UPI001FE6D5FE|nr:tetrahydrofolate dehydrogenase/cyclohydrolase catalytic domain-containing protein [Salinicoccus hispanicus]
MTTIMDGKAVAAHLSEGIRDAVEESRKHGIRPKVAFVRIGELSDAISYEKAAMKRFEKLSIETEQFHFPSDISNRAFLTKFREINGEACHGGRGECCSRQATVADAHEPQRHSDDMQCLYG